MVDKHLTVKMVELMLHHASQITFDPFLMSLELLVKILNANTARTGYILVDARHGKTAFFHGLRSRSRIVLYDMRIDVCPTKAFILRQILAEDI